MTVRRVRPLCAGAAALLVAMVELAPVPVRAQDPAAAPPPCPVPVDQLGRGAGAGNANLAVCVDRGAGATYTEGEPITLCVTVSVPQIMIFPPPPPPAVRVTNSTDGGSPRVVLAEAFNGGYRCLSGAIEAPFGRDVFRAQVLGADDRPMAEAAVEIRTRPR
jgi:hypothetical protein